MLEIKKFSAQWCIPCSNLSKLIAPIMEEYSDVNLVNIDVEENDDLCIEYKIRSVPVLVFEVDGIEIERLNGMQNRENIVELIEKYK